MTITEHIANLSAGDELDRLNAAEDLGYAGAAEGISPLVDRLAAEPSRKVRETIFLALDRLVFPEVLARVAALLDSPDAFLRNQAVGLLQRKGETAVPILLVRIHDADPDVRKFVVDIAAGIRSPAVDPIYDAALADPDVNVVIAALEYAGERRMSRLKPVVEDILRTATEPMLLGAAFATLLQIGDEDSWAGIRRRFPTAASVPGTQVGWWVRLLGRFGTVGETEVFHQILGGHYPEAITDTLDALVCFQGRHGPVAITEEFWQLLRDRLHPAAAPGEKLQLLRVMGRLSAPLSVGDFLVAALESEDRLTKLGAIDALRRLGRPELLARLRDRLAVETDAEVAQALAAGGVDK